MINDKIENLDPNKKFDKRLLVVFLIMFTEVLGFSMVLPVLPFLALFLGLTPLFIGLIASTFSFCQLFASPITGKLSDRFGRKPVFILSQISTLIGFVLLGFATSAILLIAARIVDGLFGSNMTVSQAYISDITEPKERTKVYGYSSAVFGAGLIFGPSIGGILSTINYSIPMFFAAGITILSIVLVILFLPETVTEKPEGFSIEINDIIPIKEMKYYSRSPQVRGLLMIFFLYNIAFMLFISNFALFAEIQFQVDALEIGYYQTWIGILRVLLQVFFIASILKVLGENNTLRIGVIAMVLSMLGLIVSFNYLFVFIPLIFVAFGTGVCRPILTSKLTNSVSKKESGTVLGVNSSLGSIGQIITPILGGAILEFLPAITLPALSAIFFFSIILFWRWGISQSPDTVPTKISPESLDTEAPTLP
ncbi:MAG: MFS transporter [Candidatus Hodarchaeota archaeon]